MHCFVFTDFRISGKDTDKNDNDIVSLKSTQIEKSLPVPETGKDVGGVFNWFILCQDTEI